MRLSSIRIALALAAGLLGAMPAIAAEIGGRVTDQNGQAVPYATVTVHGPHGSEQARSDADGAYHFAGLPGGTYRVEFASPGLRPMHFNDVRVDDDGQAVVDAQLIVGGIDGVIEVD